MKKLLVAGLLSASLVLPSASALAGGYHHGHHGHHNRGHINGGHLLAAAGFIGGALVIGSALSQPRYAPPPTYYQPAPRYQPTCVNDEVWRRLPDGRIQTGVRTTCY